MNNSSRAAKYRGVFGEERGGGGGGLQQQARAPPKF